MAFYCQLLLLFIFLFSISELATPFTFVKELNLYFCQIIFSFPKYQELLFEYRVNTCVGLAIMQQQTMLAAVFEQGSGAGATVWTGSSGAQCGIVEELPLPASSFITAEPPWGSRICLFPLQTWKVNNTRLFKTPLRHAHIMESHSGPGTSDVADIPRPGGSPFGSCAAAWERKWRLAAEPEQVQHRLGIA